ncbi:hypothetical protein GBA52_028793 [Prunus armeniaca]|nr:hypothetical protein GBA52_028793 [Prunus armeniaca]
MSWVQHQIQLKDGYLSYPPPFSLPSSPPYVATFHRDSNPPASSGTKISPAVLFIIVILAVLFFISGLLHLLVRFLTKHPSSSASSPQSNRGTLFNPDYSVQNPIYDFDEYREEEGYPGNGENGFTTRQKTMDIEEIVVENGILPVRLGKFRKVDVEVGGETGVGETSSSNLDARRCFSMGSYQYVLGDSDLQVPLSNDQPDRNIKLTRGIEHDGNPSIDSDVEGKKISSVTKGESYSVSKIWLWSKKGKFSSSIDTQMGMPSSLNTDLPWMGRMRAE